MNKTELLIPVGDFDCLKAAVQNGADAVYLGSSNFNARSSATNFDIDKLKEAINYAHLRNVQVHLTLNTLIKNKTVMHRLEKAITFRLFKFLYTKQDSSITVLIILRSSLTITIPKTPDIPKTININIKCSLIESE